MVPYGSQGLPLLIDVRSDEKTARRAVVSVQNADKRTVARDSPAQSLFFKKGSECGLPRLRRARSLQL